MATYYITSADSGATQLTGQDGSFAAVMDYIRTTTGITQLYTGTNKRVLLMPDGITRCRIAHDAAVSGSAQKATIRWAEGATGIDSISDEFPLTSLVVDANCTWLMSASANSTTRPWWCLVDTINAVLIFLVDTGSAGFITGGGWWSGAGSMLAVDAYPSIGWVRNTASTSSTPPPFSNSFGYFATNNSGTYWMRTRDGSVKSNRGILGPVFGTTNGGPYVTLGPSYPRADDGKMAKERVFAADLASQSGSTGANCEPRRAWIPHLWMGAHAVSSYSGISIGDTVADSAYNPAARFAWFPIGSATGSLGAILIETTDTWSAPSGF